MIRALCIFLAVASGYFAIFCGMDREWSGAFTSGLVSAVFAGAAGYRRK